MATFMELSPQNVMIALQDLSVEKTAKLVLHLGVQIEVFDNINLQYSTDICRKIHFIQAWLDSGTQPSWRKLVSGLKQIGMPVIAERVKSTFITEVTPVPTVQPFPALSTSRVSIKRVEKVKATIELFEEEYMEIKSNTHSFLSDKVCKNPRFFDKFRDHLLDLPVAKKAVHAKFFYQNEDEIVGAKDIRKLFAIIGCYCDYSNYEIILHLIKKFCEATLKRRMLRYCDSFVKFEKDTTIDVYLCANSACQKMLETFSRMAVKIDEPACVSTLHEIRRLKEGIAKEAHLHSYSVYFEGVSESSKLTVLRIPPTCVELVHTAMTPDFARVHHLAEVTVDGIPFAITWKEKTELVCLISLHVHIWQA